MLAFLGALLGALLSWRVALQLESRSRREETMRNLRWAAELAAPDELSRTDLGIAQLTALGASTLLDPEQQIFIDAALAAVTEPVAPEEG